ncbi:hypothetical protein I4U23_014490 [Adineta vaga]|nr:hypothetical protein I4U23_014490 [Adineta vaga]
MKISLFVALLVLVAATNVYGEERPRNSGRTSRPTSDNGTIVVDRTKSTNLDDGTIVVDRTKSTKLDDGTVVVDRTKATNLDDGTVVVDRTKSTNLDDGTIVVDRTKSKNRDDGTIVVDRTKSRNRDDGTFVVDRTKSRNRDDDTVVVDRTKSKNRDDDTVEVDRTKSKNRDDGTIVVDRTKSKNRDDDTVEVDRTKSKNRDRDEINGEDRDDKKFNMDTKDTFDNETPSKFDNGNRRIPKKKGSLKSDEHDNFEKLEGKDHQAPNDMEEDDDKKHLSGKDRLADLDEKKKGNEQDNIKVDINPVRLSAKTVHAYGNIVLTKFRPSLVDPVQYDLDGSFAINNANQQETRPVSPYARDFLARGSRVTLYVSTSKTTNPKMAFAKFPITYKKDNFPLTFDVEIELPDKQRGLLERADITLYFFVYITDSERLIETFLPAGTSQLLLQGTDRNVRPLDVFIRANGVEINGLFRGKFSQRFIQPGTVFQILVVDGKTLRQESISTTDAVAQLTISNVPAMFPVPFSFLVHYQTLKPNTKYYAVAYIFENGVRRLINQGPIWIINEQKLAVTTQLIFTVIPSPFILRGTITRSMPGTFVVQPDSSIVLTLHAINTNEPDIVFRVPKINSFPQLFSINVSQSSRFDPSKNYELSAQITDKNNDIYMISLQSIQLTDDIDKIILPVDDYLHYVNVRLQSSTSQQLTFIPGSNLRVLLTETPEIPSKPRVSMTIERIPNDFREFTMKIPTTGIQRNRNYYIVLMIEINGIITHVSKTLLISNNQPPPLVIQLPVLSLNLIRGVINDVDQRPAQWTSSATAKLYLLDDTVSDLEQAIVQSWTIHLENDFPIRFEVQVDFSRLHAGRIYRLQSAIESGRNLFEYKPASSAIAVDARTGVRNDVRVFVRNVKVFQLIKGLVHIQGVKGPLPEKSEIIIQLTSSPSLVNPKVVDELRIKVDNRTLPIDFAMELPINKIDINAVYYFLVRYTVRDSVVIPVSQAFAFAPRNQATIVISLSRTPQVSVTGQVTSTGSALELPRGATLHLYITDNLDEEKRSIISEVFLQSTPNSLYEFRMLVDSIMLQKKTPLYLRGDIIYEDAVILRMPRPALLQLTAGSEWNINLVIDLPTLVIGEIVSLTNNLKVHGEFDVYIQVFVAASKQVIHTIRLRLDANLPQRFRIELDNKFLLRNSDLKIRALIKNCKEETLYESSNDVSIHIGLNLNTRLTVAVNDMKKLTELRPNVDESASLYAGKWKTVIAGTENQAKSGELILVGQK